MTRLEEEARQLENLDEAFRWARARVPQGIPLETIPQDEYTHDVIFQTADREFLVFDAT